VGHVALSAHDRGFPLASLSRFSWYSWLHSSDFVSRCEAVGHDPIPHTDLRGADGASWNTNRPCGVLQVFQLRKNSIEAHRSDSRRIFKQAPARSDGFDNGKSFIPEETVILLASSLPGKGDWLTGRPSTHNVD
jgi:hypothetical protein